METRTCDGKGRKERCPVWERAPSTCPCNLRGRCSVGRNYIHTFQRLVFEK